MGSNEHVSLSREEYDALMSREQSYEGLLGNFDRLNDRSREQAALITSQATRISAQDIRAGHLQSIIGFQQQIIDALRDKTKVASLEDLSEFWRQWNISVEKIAAKNAQAKAEANKFEPDLFKSLRLWQRDFGKVDRVFSEAGTRADHEAQQPNGAREMQEHMIRRLREENARLAAHAKALEDELGPLRDKAAEKITKNA